MARDVIALDRMYMHNRDSPSPCEAFRRPGLASYRGKRTRHAQLASRIVGAAGSFPPRCGEARLIRAANPQLPGSSPGRGAMAIDGLQSCGLLPIAGGVAPSRRLEPSCGIASSKSRPCGSRSQPPGRGRSGKSDARAQLGSR